MTKKEKQTYLDKHSDVIYCKQICFASIYWWCGCRSPEHILECEDFEPVEEENKKEFEL